MERRISVFTPNENIIPLVENKPLPANFEEFLPWACVILQEHFVPIIIRGTAIESSVTAQKGKKYEPPDSTADTDASEKYSSDKVDEHNAINILATYDSCEYLVLLKFFKNKSIPRSLLKIIRLIVDFHPHLTTIHIDSGLNQNSVYELGQILAVANITEVILDGNTVKEANYYCLLENKCVLRYLSLARCQINDNVLLELTSRLLHPLSASKTLSVLNLSSNRITDNGAKYIGEMLKTNRQLAYLNLADNMITDTGAEKIFDSLVHFPLSDDEILTTRRRRYDYYIQKVDLIKKTAEEMLNFNLSKNISKLKSSRGMTANTKKRRESKLGEITAQNIDSFTEVAAAMVESQLGPFKDAYSVENTIRIDNILYCLGNNTLSYLSLAYNNITCLTVKKMYSVLSTQFCLNRNPRGLVNLCIDGNDISTSGNSDLERINSIIDEGLAKICTIPTTPMKKKGASKQESKMNN